MSDMVADCFSLLLNLDILNAAVCPFVNVADGGFAPWFYALIIFGLEMAIYLKTQNLMIPSILGLFISGAIVAGTGIIGLDNLPGPFLAAATIIFVLNIAIVIFGMFKER